MVELVALLSLAVLANWQAVETWNHGSIFSKLRARFEVEEGLLAEAMTCPFCLSHWTAAGLTTLVFLHHPAAHWEYLVIPCWLAVTRLSNFLNDLCHPFCRTPHAALDEETLNELKELAEEGNGGQAENGGSSSG